MKASIAQSFIVGIAFGITFLTAVLQVLLVGAFFLLGLVFILIAFPIYVIKTWLFK